MKKMFLIGSIIAFATCSFAADGAAVFKKCTACHGANAEKSYLNKIPVLTTLAKEDMVAKMKAYKAGELNEFKMGAVMKGQMATLNDEDMDAVADHILSLKK